jgi:hypothetical protein
MLETVSFAKSINFAKIDGFYISKRFSQRCQRICYLFDTTNAASASVTVAALLLKNVCEHCDFFFIFFLSAITSTEKKKILQIKASS